MKKILTLSALSLAAAGCFAQSSVTLYGIADVGVNRVSGIKGGSIKQLSSGIMDGSRIGFRGNEDLGGGYRAIFTLENRLELDTGGITNRPITGSQLPDRIALASVLLRDQSAGTQAALQPTLTAVANGVGATLGVNLGGNFFDRQAFVGLITPVGAVLAGRQYTPAYEVSATFDTLGTQSSLAFGQVAAIPSSIDIRASNSLAYRIQQGGFSAAAMAGAGEGSTTTGRFLGAMAMYKSDAFSVGLGYNTRENELGQKSLTSTVVGASAALGPGTVSAEYVKVKDDNPSGLSATLNSLPPAVALLKTRLNDAFKQDGAGMHLGYRMTLGVNTFYVAYNRFDDKRAVNADTSSYGAAYTYSLSKRTDINAVATRFVNSGTGQAAPGAAGYLGGVTASAGKDATSLALGVRHRF